MTPYGKCLPSSMDSESEHANLSLLLLTLILYANTCPAKMVANYNLDYYHKAK